MNCTKHFQVVALCLFLLPVMGLHAAEVASIASTAEAPDVRLRADLEKRYAFMKSAMAARDLKAIAALLAPGFESVDIEGKAQTADQMIQEISALPQDPKRISETTLLSIEQRGDSAIVVQRYHMSTTKPRPNSEATQAVDLVATSTDTWLHSNGEWFFLRTVTGELEYNVDGKVVLHKKAPNQ